MIDWSNWEMWSAIATFLATLTALGLGVYPIWKNRKEQPHFLTRIVYGVDDQPSRWRRFGIGITNTGLETARNIKAKIIAIEKMNGEAIPFNSFTSYTKSDLTRDEFDHIPLFMVNSDDKVVQFTNSNNLILPKNSYKIILCFFGENFKGINHDIIYIDDDDLTKSKLILR